MFSALEPTKTKEKQGFRPPNPAAESTLDTPGGKAQRSKTLCFLCFFWFEHRKPWFSLGFVDSGVENLVFPYLPLGKKVGILRVAAPPISSNLIGRKNSFTFLPHKPSKRKGKIPTFFPRALSASNILEHLEEASSLLEKKGWNPQAGGKSKLIKTHRK